MEPPRLLIRGFGVRVPGGAPCLTWAFPLTRRRPESSLVPAWWPPGRIDRPAAPRCGSRCRRRRRTDPLPPFGHSGSGRQTQASVTVRHVRPGGELDVETLRRAAVAGRPLPGLAAGKRLDPPCTAAAPPHVPTLDHGQQVGAGRAGRRRPVAVRLRRLVGGLVGARLRRGKAGVAGRLGMVSRWSVPSGDGAG
jgi:hypothetical protein